MHACLQNGPLRLGIGRNFVQTLAKAGLDLMRALLEGVECVVSLALQRGPEKCEALLDPRRRGVADVVQPFGQTPSASRANRSTARSSSRLNRRAAASRALRIVVSNCADAASV